MPSQFTLLQNALILDTETTGLTRGSGIHELAIYDLEKQAVQEYLFRPNLVRVQPATPQELTRLASSQRDLHQGVRRNTWMEIIHLQTEMEQGTRFPAGELQGRLQTHNPFLYEALFGGKHPHLLGRVEQQRRIAGKLVQTKRDVDIRDMLVPGGELERQIRGKTLWIANANFESKQIGAVIGAMEQNGLQVGIRGLLETNNPNTYDPFYVTGKEVNQARVLAQQTGDWTRVWRAYQANIPKAGETAVRDIQDVTRALMSYGKKLGLIDTRDQYFGQSIDVQYRLLGSLEKDGLSYLTSPELHRAAEDAAIHEQYVLRKAVQYTHALQQVQEGTEEGKRLIELASKGEGELFEAGQYFQRMAAIAPELKRATLAQRLHRAYQDLAQEGVTYQTAGYEKIISSANVTPSGDVVDVPRNLSHRIRLTSMDQVLEHLRGEGTYSEFGLNLDEEYSRFMGVAGDEATLTQYVEQQRRAVGEALTGRAQQLLGMGPPELGEAVSVAARRQAGANLSNALGSLEWSRIGRTAGMAGAALGGIGFLLAMRDGSARRPESRSLTSYNYQAWLEQQQGMYGQAPYTPGMQESGWAGQNRKLNTDFGSPYRGPFGSNYVLYDQELLQARERHLREKYGAEHFDPESGLMGVFGPFKNLQFFRGGYSFIRSGNIQRVDGEGYGLRGNNLVSLDISGGGWKIEAEDADTVVVKRGGVRGAVQSFFGMNRGYSFRMAGIDAPETSHGAQSWHAPQPRAEDAAAAFRSMLAGSTKLELVFDPSQTTYGRMMGAVIADGQNLNFELVKRGAAAHLGYGKPEDSIIDYRRMEQMEAQAYRANRGIWQTPWAQAFYETTGAAGDRVTFNTLAKKQEIVKSGSRMSMVSLMEQAQANGQFGTMDRIAAQDIGGAMGAEKFKEDWASPIMFQRVNAPHGSYMEQMMADAGNFMVTHGTGRNQNRFSRKGGYGELDGTMAIDTMNSSTSVWNKKRLKAFELYDTETGMRRERRARMAEAQRRVNQSVFNSGIGHHQM